MSFVRANGVSTHYQRLRPRDPGPAPQVVCIHGLGYDSLASFYLTLVPPLASAGFDVLAYDLRAHGRSERPESGYRLRDFTDDLLAVLDGLAIDGPVHLVGNSFGGTIAFDAAARAPERVASIVAIESEPATGEWVQKMKRTLAGVVDGMEAQRYLAWVEDTFGPHHARLTIAAAKTIRATTIIEDVPGGPVQDELSLARLAPPVLSIVGSEGFQSEDLHAVERLLPRCRTEIVAGQDHSVLVARHHEIRGTIIDWVRAHHAAAGAGLR